MIELAPPEGRGNLHASLLDDLGSTICGTLPAGTVLNADALCVEHGVSRPVVREALRVLASMGLVTTKRGVGATTQPPSAWNLFDPQVVAWRLRSPDRLDQLRELVEVRVAFEPPAAALAAERADPDMINELITLGGQLWSAGKRADPEFVEVDVAFHQLLLRASGNEMFAQLSGFVEAFLRGRVEQRLMPVRPADEALDNHLAVVQAIQQGDAEAARSATLRLVTATMNESRRLFSQPPG